MFVFFTAGIVSPVMWLMKTEDSIPSINWKSVSDSKGLNGGLKTMFGGSSEFEFSVFCCSVNHSFRAEKSYSYTNPSWNRCSYFFTNGLIGLKCNQLLRVLDTKSFILNKINNMLNKKRANIAKFCITLLSEKTKKLKNGPISLAPSAGEYVITHIDQKITLPFSLEFSFEKLRPNGKLYVVISPTKFKGVLKKSSLSETLAYWLSINPHGIYIDIDGTEILNFLDPEIPVLSKTGSWRFERDLLTSGTKLTFNVESGKFKIALNDGEMFNLVNMYNLENLFFNFVHIGEPAEVKMGFNYNFNETIVGRKPFPEYNNTIVPIAPETVHFNFILNSYSQTITLLPPPQPDKVNVKFLCQTGLPFFVFKTAYSNIGWGGLLYTTNPGLFLDAPSRDSVIELERAPDKYFPNHLLGREDFFYFVWDGDLAKYKSSVGSSGEISDRDYTPFYFDSTGSIYELSYDISNDLMYVSGEATEPVFANVFKSNPIYVYLIWYGGGDVYDFDFGWGERIFKFPYFDRIESLNLAFNDTYINYYGSHIINDVNMPKNRDSQETLVINNNWLTNPQKLDIDFSLNFTPKTTVRQELWEQAKSIWRRATSTIILTRRTSGIISDGGSTFFIKEVPYDVRHGFRNIFNGIESITEIFIMITVELVIKNSITGVKYIVKWNDAGVMRQTSFFDKNAFYYQNSIGGVVFVVHPTPTHIYIYPDFSEGIIVTIPVALGTAVDLKAVILNSASGLVATKSWGTFGQVADRTVVAPIPNDERIDYDLTLSGATDNVFVCREVTMKGVDEFYIDPVSYHKTPAPGNVLLKFVCTVACEETLPVFHYMKNLLDNEGPVTMILTSSNTFFGHISLQNEKRETEMSISDLKTISKSREDCICFQMSKNSINGGEWVTITYKGNETHESLGNVDLATIYSSVGQVYSGDWGLRMFVESVFEDGDPLYVFLATTESSIKFNTRSPLLLERFDYLPFARKSFSLYYKPTTGGTGPDDPSKIMWGSAITFGTNASIAEGAIQGRFLPTTFSGVPEFFVRFNHVGATPEERNKLFANFFNTVSLGITFNQIGGPAGWPNPVAGVWPVIGVSGDAFETFTAGGANPRTANAFLVNNGGAFVAGSYVTNAVFIPKPPEKKEGRFSFVSYSNLRINGSTSGTYFVEDFETRVENTQMVEDIDAGGNKLGTTTYCPLSFITQNITNATTGTLNTPIVSEFYPSGKSVNIKTSKQAKLNPLIVRLWYYVHSSGEGVVSEEDKHFVLPTNFSVQIGIRARETTLNLNTVDPRRHVWGLETL